MKFLESTNFFVRTISFDFINRDRDIKLKFRLVPMIHIGSKEFYNKVFMNLDECSEIFYEGTRLGGINIYGKLYQYMAKKIGLVTQSKYFDYKGLKHKLIHADIDEITGREAIQELRFLEMLKFNFIHPAQFFIHSQTLTRESLAKEFMTGAQEAYLAYGPVEDEPGTARNLVMNEREQIVFKLINQKLKQESSKEKLIGIMYGAGHMNTISRYLIDKLNYVPRNGKFMKVFDV